MAFLFGKKTFCLITGASRGLGAAISKAIAKESGEKSTFALIARKEADLRNVCEQVVSSGTEVKADPIVMDLSNPDYSKFQSLLKHYAQSGYDQAILVHNAASIGPLNKRASQLTNVDEIRNYLNLNFTATVLINSAFAQCFNSEVVPNRIVINITSGSTYIVGGFKGMHLYTATKAARDAFFRVFAAEEPLIRVLSFNPGPMVSGLQREVERDAWAHDVKKWSHDGIQMGNFSTPDRAAKILVNVLNKNEYESGTFVDFGERVMHFDYHKSSSSDAESKSAFL